MYTLSNKDNKVCVHLLRPVSGTTIHDLYLLAEGGYNQVIIESDDELKIPDTHLYYIIRTGGINRVASKGNEILSTSSTQHHIFRRPLNYTLYVSNSLNDLHEFPDEEFTVDSFGNPASERASIHQAAENLGLKVTCSFDSIVNVFKITKAIHKKSKAQFNWWKQLTSNELRVEFTGTFTNFRAKVYRVAKSKELKVQVVSSGELGVAHVKIKSASAVKSLQVRFNEFLDTLPVGEPITLPDEFKHESTSYLRVMCSNHSSDISFSRGTVTHNSPAPRFDHFGNFIYNGKNWGKREPRWIELKLHKTDYNYEDIK